MNTLKRLWVCALTLASLSLAGLLGSVDAQAADIVTYYHNDISGTPLLATDAAGNVLWKESYQPYGDKLNKQPASAGNKVGFAGKPYDGNTGLSYMGARYYDPVIGRFMGIDPKGFDEGNLHSFNRYTYANNTPYKFVDPDGKQAVLILRGLLFYVAERQAATLVVAETTAAIASGAIVPSVAIEGMAAKVTSQELRAAGQADFQASRAAALLENGGKCVYCDKAAATAGDHVIPVKKFADEINAGRITKAEAVKAANAPENIVGACKSCNSSKGAKELGATPGPGLYVPPVLHGGD